MDTQLIAEVSALVEAACRAHSNRFGYGIWSHHIRPMLPIAVELARRAGEDEEIVTLAVLLHDYAGIADEGKRQEHHVHGAEEAGRLLGARGYPPPKLERVRACILTHRGSVTLPRETAERLEVA